MLQFFRDVCISYLQMFTLQGVSSMSNLKIAAVAAIGEGSDFQIFTQNTIGSLGFPVEETAILSPYDVDSICSMMTLYHPPFTTKGEPQIEARLHLSKESWPEKDQFIADMAEKRGIEVIERDHAYIVGGPKTLCVTGIENILTFCDELRSAYSDTQLEVDVLPRPVIHPEIAGQLKDKVATIAEKSKTLPENRFHAGAYIPHDWQP